MVIDKTQFQRQTAIVDLIRSLPTAVAWAAISSALTEEAQNDLYDFLHEIEMQRETHIDEAPDDSHARMEAMLSE